MKRNEYVGANQFLNEVGIKSGRYALMFFKDYDDGYVDGQFLGINMEEHLIKLSMIKKDKSGTERTEKNDSFGRIVVFKSIKKQL